MVHSTLIVMSVWQIAPTHTLCVGSNVFFEETGSNVMHATGNVYVDRLVLGAGGILSTGGLLQLNPDCRPTCSDWCQCPDECTSHNWNTFHWYIQHFTHR
jgi:hypothetical protein